MLPFAYQVFSAVVQEKTFYQAANKLNVTPSAVSHAVSQLEKELGFPVFIRNRTGVELTGDGQRILPIIQEMINTDARLQQEADNINGLNAGSIRLGAFSSVCINWVPPIVHQFKGAYPDITVSIEQSGFDSIAQSVKLGTLDIGFSVLPISQNVDITPLVRDEIFCVTPIDFVPANGRTVTEEDVKHASFILQKGDYDKDTKSALDHYHIQPNAINFSIDDQSIIAMVEADMGMGILPKLALDRIKGNVNIYPFDDAFYRTVCLVVNPVQSKAPSTQRIIQTITNYIEENYAEEDRLI